MIKKVSLLLLLGLVSIAGNAFADGPCNSDLARIKGVAAQTLSNTQIDLQGDTLSVQASDFTAVSIYTTVACRYFEVNF